MIYIYQHVLPFFKLLFHSVHSAIWGSLVAQMVKSLLVMQEKESESRSVMSDSDSPARILE